MIARVQKLVMILVRLEARSPSGRWTLGPHEGRILLIPIVGSIQIVQEESSDRCQQLDCDHSAERRTLVVFADICRIVDLS